MKPRQDSSVTRAKSKHDDLMDKGYDLAEKNKPAKACDAWLALWEEVKNRIDPGIQNIEKTETLILGSEPIFNWCQDIEMELGNAGRNDPGYHGKRITFCDAFCARFPESDEGILFNMKRAVAESHFALGDIDLSERCFKSLIELYPDNAWAYIGWGDMYLWPPRKDVRPDYERAEQIYRMALSRDLPDEDEVMERIEAVQKERDRLD